MLLIRFLAGLAAFTVPALIVMGAIVAWALIRRRFVRYAVVGFFLLLLSGNAVALLIQKGRSVPRDAAFAELCANRPKPTILATRSDVRGIAADYDVSSYQSDPAAAYAGTFYPNYLLERFLLGGANPYERFATRTSRAYEIKTANGFGDVEEKRQAAAPEIRVGYRWEKHADDARPGIAGFDLVMIDLDTQERLAVLPTYATYTASSALFPAFAVAQTPGQFERVQRCPSIGELSAFIQSVAKP